MKKKLSRSLLTNAINPPASASEDDAVTNERAGVEDAGQGATPKPKIGGAGSAWKSGAMAQTSAELGRQREKVAQDILNGRHVIELDPDQIADKIGSDRRPDWMEQPKFQSILESIRDNGQDTPIHVWPEDPDWTPDRIDPENIENVPFELIFGRTRTEIARRLGRRVRAVLAPPEKRGTAEEKFELLFMRYRENAERENLSPFEQLLSIGEMFESLNSNASGAKITAVSFGEKIGVHESIVSRGRAVYKAKDQILNIFKNVYELSFPELQKAVASLAEGSGRGAKKPSKPRKVSVTRKVGKRNLKLASQGGKLTVSAAGLNMNKERLEGLSEVIAAYLEEHGIDQ